MTTQRTSSLNVRPDRRLIRPNSHSKRFVLAEIVAPRATSGRGRSPVHLALVIDRSGSMSGDKLRVAKSAAEEAIGRLQTGDRFSVIVYDDVVETVIESTHASAESRRAAVERLRSIEARGSTNLAEGWLRGCEQLARYQLEQGVNRCLLLTDGLANVGETNPAVLANHAAELRARGISTSTFGVGNDFDETLLQALADAGGGHFYYIADAPQIRDAITSEVGETLEIVARDVTLEVTAREDVRVEPISPYTASAHGNRTFVSLGDLGSEQSIAVVLRLSFPYGDLGREVGVIVSLADRDGVFAADGIAPAEAVRLTWTYADNRANDEQPRDRSVDHVVARLYAARARQGAVASNRGGNFSGAGRQMAGAAARIRSYADGDPELMRLAESLDAEAAAFAAPMAEMSRKQMYFASSAALRSRDSSGRSIKHS